MKTFTIPSLLPKFNQKTLFLVFGKRTVDIYKAYNAEIEKEFSFSADEFLPVSHEQVPFSDISVRQNRLLSRVRDKHILGLKSYEAFTNKVTEYVTQIIDDENIRKLYIFAPRSKYAHIKNNYEEIISGRFMHIFKGNYKNVHLYTILEAVKKYQARRRRKTYDQNLKRSFLRTFTNQNNQTT